MRTVLTILVVGFGLASSAYGQVLPFGSSDDPTELEASHLREAPRFVVMGGPSYLGVRWRVVGGVEVERAVGPLAISVEGHLRVGPRGLYRVDVSEPYDLLRLIRYARIDPTPRVPIYARLGPIRRLTLESGLLVRDFATVAAWDERTVGLEVAARHRFFEVGGFSADVRPQDLVGGFVAMRPFAFLASPRLSSIRLSAHGVHDLGLHDEEATTALAAEARMKVFGHEALGAGLIVSHARYLNYGHGTLAGIDASADLFDIGFWLTRLGMTFSSAQFIPGHFDAFYQVHNPRSRIVSSDAYFRDPATNEFVGTTLDESEGGTALFFEIRGIVYNSVEVAQYLRRDFGGSTGAFGFRLALYPDQGQTLRFLFDLQRHGLRGFGDLFSDLVDEAILTFRIDYALSDLAHAFIRSRYGYTSVGDLPDGTTRYLVERRFEPMAGIAFSW